MNATTTIDRALAAHRVRSASDPDTLKRVVADLGVLVGNRGQTYSAQELIEKIDAALEIPLLVDRITRALGLRAKVREFACAAIERGRASPDGCEQGSRC